MVLLLSLAHRVLDCAVRASDVAWTTLSGTVVDGVEVFIDDVVAFLTVLVGHLVNMVGWRV